MRQRTKDKLSEFSQLAGDVALVTKNVLSSVKPRAVSSDRCRQRISVWLEIDKPDQRSLCNWIKKLKLKRQFAPIVRNALSIYHGLLVGDTSMLYHFFPDIKPAPPPTTSPEIEKMKKKIESLEDQVELLKGILIKQSGPGAVDMGVKMADRVGDTVHTPRQTFAQRPSMAAPSPAIEADTSTAFLDAF